MGQYIYGLVLVLFTLTIYVVFHTTQMFQEQYFKAKYYTEEIAAAAAQYHTLVDYSEGYYNFDRIEANKAIDYYLRQNFYLSHDYTPREIGKGYWQDQMKYEVTFIDYSSNNTFPGEYTYTHFDNTHTVTLNGPSVILTVYLGKAPQKATKLFNDIEESIVTAIHTFEE